MASHDVRFKLPKLSLGKMDAEFFVRKDGKKLGTLKLSNGGVDWHPQGSDTFHRITWTDLTGSIEHNGTEMEKK